MIEKLKNISNKKIVIVSITIMIIVLVLGFTYAYWTRTFTQSGVNRNTYDCFDINFKEKVEGITIENGYPITDEEGMQSTAYEVEIINTCNIAASYNVILNKLNTSTLDSSHIKIAVDNDIRLLSETEEVTSTIENAIEGRIISSGVLAGKDSKTISVRSWMDEATTKEEGSNKVFANKITIEAVATNNMLAEAILKNNKLHSNKPDVSKSVISKKIYDNLSDSGYTSKSRYIVGENGLYQDQDDEGKTYYFRGVVDNNYVKIKGLKWNNDYTSYIFGDKSTSIEKSSYATYEEIANQCQDNFATYGYLNKEACIEDIKDVGHTTDDDMVFRIVRINGDGSIRLITDSSVGESTFNNETGEEYYGGYTYPNLIGYEAGDMSKNTTTVPRTMNNYYADEFTYNPETRKYILVNPVKHTKIECYDNKELCANKYTMNRLSTEDYLMFKTTNEWPSTTKVVAYTYTSMGKPIFDQNTNNDSTIKQFLDNWYNTSLNSYDNLIAKTAYCNDTSSADINDYASRDYQGMRRVAPKDEMDYNPTFTCPNDDLGYGGKYQLKVGLLSADEMDFAGGIRSTYNSSFYLYAGTNDIITMTPAFTYYGKPHQFMGYAERNSRTLIGYGFHGNEVYDVRPVINLKASVKILKGNGSQENPYIIE